MNIEEQLCRGRVRFEGICRGSFFHYRQSICRRVGRKFFGFESEGTEVLPNVVVSHISQFFGQFDIIARFHA